MMTLILETLSICARLPMPGCQYRVACGQVAYGQVACGQVADKVKLNSNISYGNPTIATQPTFLGKTAHPLKSVVNE